MNEMKYWLDGRLWGATETSDPGTTKYWLDGKLYGNVYPTSTPPSPPTSSFMI